MLFAIARGKSGSGWAFMDLPWGMARVFYGFGAGVALYRVRDRFPVPRLPLPILVAALFLLLFLIPTSSKVLLGVLFFGLFPLLILSGWRAKIGSERISYWAGQLSYPFYILHWPVYYWILGALAVTGVHPPGIATATIGLLCAIVASFLILKYVDIPTRRLLTALRTTRP
jgi:peptidoglycan/LPS O-acetylase OafA/YrhL